MQQQPIVAKPPAADRIARCIIEIGAADFSVVARGELAELAGGCPAGTFLTIEGDLVSQVWKTGEGKPRTIAEIIARTIKIGPRSEGQT